MGNAPQAPGYRCYCVHLRDEKPRLRQAGVQVRVPMSLGLTFLCAHGLNLSPILRVQACLCIYCGSSSVFWQACQAGTLTLGLHTWAYVHACAQTHTHTLPQTPLPQPDSIWHVVDSKNLVNPWGFQVVQVVKNPPANAGDMRDTGPIPESGRSPGGGHGNPLQYSCLEISVDRGAWWATVHGEAKSRTRLKLLGCTGSLMPVTRIIYQICGVLSHGRCPAGRCALRSVLAGSAQWPAPLTEGSQCSSARPSPSHSGAADSSARGACGPKAGCLQGTPWGPTRLKPWRSAPPKRRGVVGFLLCSSHPSRRSQAALLGGAGLLLLG